MFTDKLKKACLAISLAIVMMPSNLALHAATPITYLNEQWNDANDHTYPWSGPKEITEDGHLKLKSNSGLSLIDFPEVKLPDEFTYEFRAKINSYGPDDRNKNSLATKLELGTHRLMFTIEKNGLYGCNANSTWTKLSNFKSDLSMHTYRFEISKTTMSAKLYIDDAFITTISLQKGGYGSALQYWVNGTAALPTEAEVDYSTITYEAPKDALPIWTLSNQIKTSATQNSITLHWEAAQGDVASYKIYKDGTLLDTIDGDVTSYEYDGLSSSSPYYKFKIEAENHNGLTTNGPSASAKTTYDKNRDVLDVSNVFDQAQPSKYTFGYRIPGLVVTKKNTLLAYTEARKNGSDWAPMDLLMKRSTDGGETWSEHIVVPGLDKSLTVNNPVMIVGEDNTIHLLYCVEYGVESRNGGVYYMRSENDGLTWSEAVDVSASFYSDEFKRSVVATGPGHGIQLHDGTLIVPIWMAYKEGDPTSHQPSVVSSIYSKDNGKSWNMGEVVFATAYMPNPNETIITQLNDGRVMLNIRNQGGAKRRAVTTSPNGYSDWETPTLDQTLVDPGCFGGITRYDDNTILFVNANSPNSRTNGTVRASFDEGETWAASHVIEPESYAYSDIAVDEDKTIYVLFESQPDGTSSLKLARFTLNWVKEANKGKLKDLTCSNGTFTSPFKPDKLDYIVNVNDDAQDVDLNFTPAFDNAEIYVNDTLCTENTIKIHMDQTRKDVKITVKNDDVSNTYNIILKRKPSQDTAVAYIDFDYVKDDKLQDVTLNGNDFTNHGASIQSGKFGDGITFSGGSNYLSLADTNGLKFGTDDFTVSMWVKPSALTGTNILAWYGTTLTKQWWLRHTNGVVEFCLSTDGSESVVKSTSSVLKTNEWQMVTAMRRGNEQKILVNGNIVASKINTVTYDINGEDSIYIGKAKFNDARVYQGAMDDIRFYRYALSDSEINALVKAKDAVAKPWNREDLQYVLGLIHLDDQQLSEEQKQALTEYVMNGNTLLNKNDATPEFLTQRALDEFAEAVFTYLHDQSIIQGDVDDLSELVENELDMSGFEDGMHKDTYIKTLAQAKVLLNNEQPSIKAVHTTYLDLQEAIKNLQQNMPIYKEILSNAIAKAERLNFDNLAPSVKAMLEMRLAEAKAVYAKENATEIECFNAWLNLANALHYMDFEANKTVLKALIDECNQINTDDYTIGVEAFKEALTNAQMVYDNDHALQASINEAVMKLNIAKDGLRKDDVDKALLQYIYDAIMQNIGDGSKYNQKDEAWGIFTKTLESAKAVLHNNEATQEDINNAFTALTNAYLNIRLLPDEALLKELQDFVKMIDNTDLTSYNAAQIAYIMNVKTKIQEMINHPENITQKSITQTQKEMKEVIDILRNGDAATQDPITPPAEQTTDMNNTVNEKAPQTMGSVKPGTTKTGDTTNAIVLGSLALASTAILTGLKKKRKQ